MSNLMRAVKGPVAPLVVAGVSLLVIAVWMMRSGSDPDNGSPASSDVFFVHGMERIPSQTADEWVQVADVVVVGRVVSEARSERSISETSAADGIDLVGRSVDVEVDHVLWESADASKPAPTRFELDAAGWAEDADGTTREMTFEGSSRLEPGHTYVMALAWKPAECSEGDEPDPAGWSIIGSGGVIPADDGVVGKGEFQGSVVTLVKPSATSTNSVLARVLSGAPSELSRILQDVGPVERVAFVPKPARC